MKHPHHNYKKLPTAFFALLPYALFIFLGLSPRKSGAQTISGSFPVTNVWYYDSLITISVRDGVAQTTNKDYNLALQTFLSVYEYVQALPDTASITWVYYKHLADLMATLGATDLCIEFSKKAYYHSKKSNPEPSISIYQRVGSIGSKYIELGQFDSAAVYLHESLDIAGHLPDLLYLAAAYNNLGILEEQSGKPDALQYYRMALSCMPVELLEGDGLFGSIHDNLAGWYISKADYKAALQHCDRIYEWLRRKEISDTYRWSKTILKEMQCWDKRGKTKEAITKLMENRALYDRLIFPAIQLEYFHLLADMLKREKRYEEMGAMLSAAQPVADSLSTRQVRLAKLAIHGVTQVRTSSIRRDLENLELKSRQQAFILEKEQQTARYRGLLLLFVLFAGSVFVLFGFLFYSRKVTMQAKKLELETMQKELTETKLINENLEKERLAMILENKEKDLSGLVMHITQVRDWQSSLLQSLESIEPKAGKDALPVIRKVTADLRNRLLTDERLKIFQDNIEVLDRRFFAQLRERHPRLTTEDLHLCGCFRLNMSAKDIASMRGISLKSINMSRYRLRKKLQLKPEADLNIYLQNL